MPTSVPHDLTAASSHTRAPGHEWAGTLRRHRDRLPLCHRLDVRLTHLSSHLDASRVASGEVMYALIRPNAASLAYAPEHSTRSVHEGCFSRRIQVAGVSLSW